MMNHIPAWCTSLIGIPFVDLGRDENGADCWGLTRLVLEKYANLRLPSLATGYESECNHVGVENAIETERASGEWIPIDRGDQRIFDVVEIAAPTKIGDKWEFHPLHVGILVSTEMMLHTERATGARLTPIKDMFMSRRILGFWRHHALINANH